MTAATKTLNNAATLKTKLSKTAAATNTPVSTQPAPATAIDGLMSRYAEAQSALLSFFNAPSWKRTLCAVITYVAGVSGVAVATTALTEWLFVGAIAASVPTFLAVCVAVLAAITLAWYGHKLVMRVTGAILTKEADEKAAAAYDAVKSLARRFNPFVKLVPAAGGNERNERV